MRPTEFRLPLRLYIVRRLPAGLYELTYPLRFKDGAAPLNHAHFCGRGQNGKAIVLSCSARAVASCLSPGKHLCDSTTGRERVPMSVK